ncbi:MAG TPA: response regulator [Cytophagaceae bacterium]
MRKAIIIDDEKKSRITLRNQLEKYCENIQIIAEADSVQSGINEITRHNPEVVFLDIQMPDGTGFDLLNSFNEINFKIIFITAYDQFAVKAFKFSAVDYLLKPVDPDQLVAAVKKLEKMDELTEMTSKLRLLMENKLNIKKIALPTFEGIKLAKIDEIIRCEADSNYTTIYITNNRKIVVTRTLKEYEELLSGFDFVRIHKSHLINLRFVDKYVSGDGGYVIMEDGSQVEVARRRKDVLLNLLLNQ